MNKFAIVTGASSGIGLEFAKLLASDNYDLLLAARDKKGLDKVSADLEEKHNVSVEYLAIDLSEQGSADKLWSKANDRSVDVLVNNAGFGDLAQLVDADWKKLKSMIDLNISTLTRLSQLAAASMKKNGHGRILNVASIAAFIPGPGMATYYATKAYVLSFSEALSEELRDSGVTVTSLCPGPTKTNFSKAAGANKSKLFSGNIPTAKEVAQYGYKSMTNGKVIAVHGVKNKINVVLMPRLLPKSVIRKIVSRIQKT